MGVITNQGKLLMRRIASSILCLGLVAASGLSQGKISGYMFGDYFYNIARDANIGSLSDIATKGETAFQAFQFRRIYFKYDNNLSADFATRFRLEADQGDRFSSGRIGVVVKDAYLRWKDIFDGSDAFFGIQPTPAFEISEAAWGYRSLEKTILDLRGIVSSRDFGVSLRGNLVKGGTLGYWLMIANGSSHKPETDTYKRYYAHLSVKPNEQVQASLYADYAERGERANPFSPGTRVSNGAFTTALFLGYAEKEKYSAGVEGFLHSTLNGYNNGSSLETKTGFGLSIFGSVDLQSNVALMGRYDYFDPNTDSNARGDVRNYLIAGLSWKPDKNVSLIPNILYESYETLPNGTSVEASITGRLTLYFVFL